jgi:hypothetical protein
LIKIRTCFFVPYLKPILRHGWLSIRCDLLGGAVRGGVAVAVPLQATAKSHQIVLFKFTMPGLVIRNNNNAPGTGWES